MLWPAEAVSRLQKKSGVEGGLCVHAICRDNHILMTNERYSVQLVGLFVSHTLEHDDREHAMRLADVSVLLHAPSVHGASASMMACNLDYCCLLHHESERSVPAADSARHTAWRVGVQCSHQVSARL